VTSQAEVVFRREWGRAVAVVTRLTGDLGLAEDAVQEAFAAAVTRWSSGPLPSDPSGWLITVAKNNAVDRVRREARRPDKEQAAMLMLSQHDPPPPPGRIADDQLRLIFTCCHPALDPGTRVALTLRTLCGLTTAEIARLFLVSEATLAQRLVRAKRKIRDAGIPFRVPADEELPGRVGTVLRVVYLVFTEGHRASAGPQVVRYELCDEAIRLARLLAGLCPDDPEVLGLLALPLLTDARRDARVGGRLVLLEEQDRGRWDRTKIDEGVEVLDRAARRRRSGPYQLQAAIAACHATAAEAGATDWAEIAALYAALARCDPSPVVHANRAVAVAMADGPAAGLAIVDQLLSDGQGRQWHLLHACRADLLRRLGRTAEAAAAYRTALALDPPPAERDFLAGRLTEIDRLFALCSRPGTEWPTTAPRAGAARRAGVRRVKRTSVTPAPSVPGLFGVDGPAT
jgi:RNA polymerase sigma-70 factor (ECF subfamily)